MKLANKLHVVTEAFKGDNVYVGTVNGFFIPDTSNIMAISTNRGSYTKALLLFSKDGNKARLIQLNMKLFINARFSSLGAPASLSDYKYESTDHFVKTVEKNFDDLLTKISRGSFSDKEKYKKKYGLASVTDDTGWVDKNSVVKELQKNSVPAFAIRSVPELPFDEIGVKKEEVHGFSMIDAQPKHKVIVKVIEDSVKILKKHGFDKLIYGNIYFAKEKKKKRFTTFADYRSVTDDIRIFDAGFEHEESHPVQTFIHELGHRLYYKFLNQSQRLGIVAPKFQDNLYTFKSTSSKEIPFKVGDVFEFTDGEKYKYMGYTAKNLGGRKLVYKLNKLKDDGTYDGRYYFFEKTQADRLVKFVYEKTGKKPEKEVNFNSTFLPSAYSRTSDVEWFAEVFAHSLVNNDKEGIEWLKTLK